MDVTHSLSRKPLNICHLFTLLLEGYTDTYALNHPPCNKKCPNKNPPPYSQDTKTTTWVCFKPLLPKLTHMHSSSMRLS